MKRCAPLLPVQPTAGLLAGGGRGKTRPAGAAHFQGLQGKERGEVGVQSNFKKPCRTVRRAAPGFSARREICCAGEALSRARPGGARA